MDIIPRSSLSKNSSGFNETNLPYLFTEKYENYTRNILKNDYLLFYDKDTNAVMPVQKLVIKSFSMLQPLYPPVTLEGERLKEAEEKAFLNSFIDYVKTQKVAIRIAQSHSNAVFKAVPEGSVSCPFGTYIITLTGQTEDELFNKVHSRTRRYIKGMAKNNVTIKWGQGTLDDLYTLYKDTMQRSSTYCEPFKEIEEFANQMGNYALYGVAYWQDKPQGGLFVAYTKHGGYSLYAGSAEHVENNGTMHFLYWEAILQMKRQEVKLFDCVGARLSDVSGTKQGGIQNFKEKLGGELVEGHLWKMDIDSVRCKLFDTLLQTKLALTNKKRYKDIIDQEIEKTKAN